MTYLTVGTADLRAGLASVAPHISDVDTSPIARLRLTADEQNVWVTATNGFSAGLAIVSTEDFTVDDYHTPDDDADEDDQPTVTVDLHPTEVKEILTLFKAAGGSTDDHPDEQLRIDVDGKYVTVTEVAGLFNGKALRLPRHQANKNFPDVAATIYRQLSNTGDTDTDRLLTSGKLLGLFGAAARAYGEALVLEPTGEQTALVVSCGESFLGLLSPQKANDEKTAELNEWRQAWMGRLTRRGRILEPA